MPVCYLANQVHSTVFLADSRKKFVAHERFQYILLKKFGETDVQVSHYGMVRFCL